MISLLQMFQYSWHELALLSLDKQGITVPGSLPRRVRERFDLWSAFFQNVDRDLESQGCCLVNFEVREQICTDAWILEDIISILEDMAVIKGTFSCSDSISSASFLVVILLACILSIACMCWTVSSETLALTGAMSDTMRSVSKLEDSSGWSARAIATLPPLPWNEKFNTADC